MLSICIPVYNFSVVSLVKNLHQQAINEKINFEIIVVDDFSTSAEKFENREIQNLQNVQYFELEKNIGRSRIRNFLCEKANFEFLLFLDCDSKIPDSFFIKRYLVDIQPNRVIYGGRNYEIIPPQNKNYFLRWKYGILRESKNAKERNIISHRSFTTNNFLIPKKVLKNVKFNENLEGYGHEDTLLGYELLKNRIEIFHIDNPATHIGLETAAEFLQKTQNGVKNLNIIAEMYQNETQIFQDIKLLRYFRIVKKLRLKIFVKFLFKIFVKKIEKNLISEKPSLVLFDFFKLGILCDL